MPSGSVSNPASVVTLKDGAHPWVEVQAAAMSADAGFTVWDKDVYYQPDPPQGQPRSSRPLNPVLPVLPYPYKPEQISGFRDPAVAAVAEGEGGNSNAGYSMIIGSGFLCNETTAVPGGGAIFQYAAEESLNSWSYTGILLMANHTMAQSNGAGKDGNHSNPNPNPNPVDTDTMWECPDLFALPVREWEQLGKYSVLIYGSKGKVVYHLGDVVDSADLPAAPAPEQAPSSSSGSEGYLPNQPYYSRGNQTFVSYVRGVLDMGYFYAARSQSYSENTAGNNPNIFNNGELSSYYSSSTARLLWGWVPEGSSRTDEQNMYQGWAGVMSLPRVLSLEFHELANSNVSDTSFEALFPTSYMYNSAPYIGAAQQQRRQLAAQSLQLVVAPAPAVNWLRRLGNDTRSADLSYAYASDDAASAAGGGGRGAAAAGDAATDGAGTGAGANIDASSDPRLGLITNDTIVFKNFANVTAAVAAAYDRLTIYDIAADVVLTLSSTC